MIPQSISSSLSSGNPSLQPERAWNYDLLAEHYFPSVGVLSGGAFYKDITNFIFDRTAPYTGPIAQYNFHLNGDTIYYLSQPQNGPRAQLWGVEVDYMQHLTFLPGVLQGIGFDVNWTHVESRATVPIPGFDSVSYTGPNGNTVFPYTTPFRHSPIPRQFPTMSNVALLYDYSPSDGPDRGQYTSASMYSYGSDGTSNPASGDTWNYAHWQMDGSVVFTVYGTVGATGPGAQHQQRRLRFFHGRPAPGSATTSSASTTARLGMCGVRQGI